MMVAKLKDKIQTPSWQFYIGCFLVLALLRFIVFIAVPNCTELYTFDGDMLYQLIVKCINAIRIIAILLVTNRFLIKTDKYKKWGLRLCIVLISLIADYPSASKIIKSINPTYRTIQKSICNKCTDNLMTFTAQDLNLKEYEFFSSKNAWLPKVPKAADSISIDYYRDDFLGDYSLDIQMKSIEKLTQEQMSIWKTISPSSFANPPHPKGANWYLYNENRY